MNLLSIYEADLLPPKLLEQTQMETHPTTGTNEGVDGHLATPSYVFGYGSVVGGGIRRSSSSSGVRVRGPGMYSSLFPLLCPTCLRLDRGGMIMRFAWVSRACRLFELLLGYWMYRVL